LTMAAFGANRQAILPRSVLWNGGASGVALLLFAVLPIPLESRIQLCGWHWLTGGPCPFCGLTRALSCLAKGQWEAALQLHPLSPLALAILAAIFLESALELADVRKQLYAPPARVRSFLMRLVASLFVVYGAFRFLLERLDLFEAFF